MKLSKLNFSFLCISLFVLLMFSGCAGRMGSAGLYQDADDPARFFPLLEIPLLKRGSHVFVYKLYSGKERKNDELVRVQLKHIDSCVIDGLIVDASEYQEVLLLPGKHLFTWKEYDLNASEMDEERVYELTAETKANHTYALYADFVGGTDGDRFFFRIKDINSSEVIAGRKKP